MADENGSIAAPEDELMAEQMCDLITETGEHFDVIIASPARLKNRLRKARARILDRMAVIKRKKDKLANYPELPDSSKRRTQND